MLNFAVYQCSGLQGKLAMEPLTRLLVVQIVDISGVPEFVRVTGKPKFRFSKLNIKKP